MNPTYLGDIELNEDTLAHYGVKGMKLSKMKTRILKSYDNAKINTEETEFYRRKKKK